jgi:fatty acid CoA ligase FadD9
MGKPLRPALRRRYAERLEARYDELERQQLDELVSLRSAGKKDTRQSLVTALAATLGAYDVDLDSGVTFAELGGDSLSAVELSVLLEDVLGVPVPVGTITNPSGTVGQLARYLDDAVAARTAGHVTFQQVHPDPERLRSEDLALDKFFDTGSVAPVAPRAKDRVVLLTGANGYLGRFLLLEWLERVADSDGRVVCVVRATDAQAARRRIDALFVGPDAAMQQRYSRLAAAHLEVLAGDITQAWLGLPAPDYLRLSEEIDRIVHCAAMVNHVLDYRHLFPPNVAGTAEVIRLALTGVGKRIDYVSSVAVAHLGAAKPLANEDADPRTLEEVVLSGSYASGYATSKWAGEVLLRQAHERFGVPVTVFRSDMILAHQRYRGQINAPDTFTRLLYSLIATGLAPASFYDSVPGARRPHYDGFPVDFVAAAVARIAAARDSSAAGGRPSYRTFNVVNDHDDGYSLDTFVDWIIAAGYPIRRIAGHAEWLADFRAALTALPDAVRSRSSLAVLDQLRRPRRAGPADAASTNFARALEALTPPLPPPHLTEAFVGKCLADLRELGFVGEPLR